MIEVTSTLIKELRQRTSAGMMDCKKALIQAQGDIELAIENMRKSGSIKAAKKANNITTEGIIQTKIVDNYGVILEVNCQTDFVAKDNYFKAFSEKILNTAITENINNIDMLKIRFEEERISLVVKMGENINIRRFFILTGDILTSYLHGSRIGVLIATKGSDKQFAKQLAMHIAASNPEFIKPEDISTKLLEKEYQVQMDIAMNSGKTAAIAQIIVRGRMKKFTNSISLICQDFVMDPNKTVGQLLKEYNTVVTDFIRFEVGEDLKNKT
ncbi:Elongation factor Ts [Candidatus Profftia lariciata]|uniref:translation elongation factor Ts n=1 Tax=Candidatus Profftia lariciata TaxID=1987921 RepID=UPI001D028B3B|nr:translation elongation factor Ts [Candidatus Profftia lariciata]UDG81556.1 Elongation factor Ts [Candidatus Profftia lariciata]